MAWKSGGGVKEGRFLAGYSGQPWAGSVDVRAGVPSRSPVARAALTFGRGRGTFTLLFLFQVFLFSFSFDVFLFDGQLECTNKPYG